jgi:uncharacterized iron-regulated membrane protein
VLWHRWFGLLAALWLTLMAVTGSVIVFYDEADTALNPDLRTVSPSAVPLPPGRIVAAAEAHRAGAHASFVNLPDSPTESAQVFLRARKDSNAEITPGTYVMVDPYSGIVLGERIFGAFTPDRRHLMDMIYQLHIDLMLGDWMVWFLGLVALFWTLDHIAALVLSFPVAAKWVQSFRIRRHAKGHKFVFDLHRATGLWFFPVTLVLAFSGLYLNWHEEVIAAVETVSPVTHRYNEHAPYLDAPLYSPPVGYNAAVSTAAARAGKPVDMIRYFPWQALYIARAFDDRDIDPYGRRMIAVNATTGAIMDDYHAASGTAGDIFLVWQYPLHSGKAFGWPGRIVIFLSGIVVTGFCITGILLWWRKRKARTART